MAEVDFEMRVAGSEDLATVREILDEASEWLHSRSIEQWPERWDDRWIRPGLDAGEVYLAERDGRAIATIALQWSDDMVWGPQAPDAGYVHRLAVRRADAGVGRALLEWAAARVASGGRSFLRLDCWSGNERLRAYYERAGFEYRGDTSEERWTVSRYERRCSSVE